MKKLCITFCVLLILIATVLAAYTHQGPEGGEEGQYLRIHVRANSNSAYDQSVKYTVKDAVVSFITPYISSCTTKERAMQVVSSVAADIEGVCDGVLEGQGVGYRARAQVKREYFPTRVYDGATLGAGEYDALIIELGEGKGDNWWCVIYPPLCFTSASADVSYKSIIKDIIDKFFARG